MRKLSPHFGEWGARIGEGELLLGFKNNMEFKNIVEPKQNKT